MNKNDRTLADDFGEAGRERRIDKIWLVMGKPAEERIQAFADLKLHYKEYKEATALINKRKFICIPFDLLLQEIIKPTTDLFSAAQRKKLVPLAVRLQENENLPNEKKVSDLAGLKEQYKKSANAVKLIDRAAFHLPDAAKAPEISNPKTNLFSSRTIADYRNQYKI
ncbi:MAG: hypothetical protein CO093_03215 [Alphaproteobacteria bacterium CG_4_9_14_3_um_filter_47_13]|nr:MAG: hypothetical protein CO093_03215 [Alphaproteobacteria bacterium CG_4_9_14_3_um_filter_47_13]